MRHRSSKMVLIDLWTSETFGLGSGCAHAQMLYDQPQLVRAHLDAFALTGGRRHAATARGILDYLLRDLAAPGGGFFSAEART